METGRGRGGTNKWKNHDREGEERKKRRGGVAIKQKRGNAVRARCAPSYLHPGILSFCVTFR